MEAKQLSIRYYINTVEQTFLKRVLPTKTFKAAAVVVVTAAIAVVEKKIEFDTFVDVSTTSVALILLRAVLSKVQLANDAANPELPQVVAVEHKPKGGGSGPLTGLMSAVAVAVVAGLIITACADKAPQVVFPPATLPGYGSYDPTNGTLTIDPRIFDRLAAKTLEK